MLPSVAKDGKGDHELKPENFNAMPAKITPKKYGEYSLMKVNKNAPHS